MAIIPIWQPLGYSTNKIAKRVAEKYGTKGTHTGTLDPMAEGVIIVLTQDDRFKKYDLAGWKKSYEFEILFGVKTDSYDALGFITKEKQPDINISEIVEVLKSFAGDYTQKVPAYSAIKYKGKKLFEYAKQGITIETLPQKKGKVYDIGMLDYRTISRKDAVEQILTRLRNIKGDFRQRDIVSQWEAYYSNLNKEVFGETFPVLKIFVETSKGLYVRSLSQDISAKLKEIGFVFSLVRVKNGEYTREDCKNLEDIFGHDYDMLFRPDINS